VSRPAPDLPIGVFAPASRIGHSVLVASEEEVPTVDELIAALQSGKAVDYGPNGPRIRDPQPTADPGDATSAEPAVDASGDPWLYVERWPFDFDLEVGYSDEMCAFHDAEIEESIMFLRSLPGVETAVRGDPEQIFILGTRDARRIRDSLIAWWSDRR
jgi:hypothetical protein